MKKSFLLFPLVVSASLVLSACSSSSSEGAEVADVNSNGISSAPAVPSWQSSEAIQSVDMPTSMSSAPTQTMGQSTYRNPTSYSTQPTSPSYNAQSETVGNCQVVRDATGAPMYAQITKGCYTESSYTVGKSDTMYLISYLTGQTPAQIAALNNISTTTKLQVGQVLRVR
ncbi:LysM peptidoglycan-binding domain-containing protein [Actinobacillus genomosp. 2]|uniref:LysM peptidoglycan-binding domain-containing protein n=1 Tax=Actinobacillus genomosp. 2 TaxID=230709 RepID=UPI0024422CC9|nr:LysM domain-containing protein [Actinobacillus genomosp. 2]WGE31484.1 LysM peptidoglycan-binding domain-containing protein [Actinobacillus genomosp. 2]